MFVGVCGLGSTPVNHEHTTTTTTLVALRIIEDGVWMSFEGVDEKSDEFIEIHLLKLQTILSKNRTQKLPGAILYHPVR